MNVMFKGLLVLAALAGASSAMADEAARGERALAREIEGRVAGPPVDCLTFTRPYRTEVINKTAILYRLQNGAIIVNRPLKGAEGMDDGSVVRARIGKPTVCSNDVLPLYFSYGGDIPPPNAVTLGQFVPYSKRR